MSKPNCKICSSPLKHIFNSKILYKHDVAYYKCTNCGFIQTDEPYWLNEAYDSAIANLDLGLISRNLNYAKRISNLIINNFDINANFLDYAGGYGIFTRLMRDKGFDYYHQDKFCANLYAQNSELDSLPKKTKFELVTAFEVFEHFVDPIEEIKKIFKYSDVIVFSTELCPDLEFNNSNQWWYFAPETGQHIAFYSKKSLEFIANTMSLFFYTQNNLHILSKTKLDEKRLFLAGANHSNLKSLLEEDFQLARKINKINNSNKLTKNSSQSYKKSASVFEAKLLNVLNKLEYKNKEIIDKNKEISNLLKVRKNLESHLLQKQSEISLLNSDLNTMQSTKLWQIAEIIRFFIKPLFQKIVRK